MPYLLMGRWGMTPLPSAVPVTYIVGPAIYHTAYTGLGTTSPVAVAAEAAFGATPAPKTTPTLATPSVSSIAAQQTASSGSTSKTTSSRGSPCSSYGNASTDGGQAGVLGADGHVVARDREDEAVEQLHQAYYLTLRQMYLTHAKNHPAHRNVRLVLKDFKEFAYPA